MEIPKELKRLYKHWDKHTNFTEAQKNTALNSKVLHELEDFATERMRVWEKKCAGQEKPYTSDAVLQKYRFCNIYRELDKQTIEIHKDLKPLEDDFNLWLLNLAFHRFICRPHTVEKVGHLSFSDNNAVYNKLVNLERPKYGNAYVFPISTIQKSDYPTREEFFCFYLPRKIPEIADIIKSFDNKTVHDALEELLPIFGFNMKFHWAEILIDVSYQFPEYINLHRDFHIGPGALPTAKLLSSRLPPEKVADTIVNNHLETFPYLTYNHKPVKLSAENWEGVFCEFRKYSNLKENKGRKRIYS